MLLVLFAILTASAPGFGAPYPAATLDGPVTHEGCFTRYHFTTSAPIAKVAAYYRAEGAAAGVALLDDSGTKFVDYRMITFVQQPHFLTAVLSARNGRTVGIVAFHARAC